MVIILKRIDLQRANIKMQMKTSKTIKIIMPIELIIKKSLNNDDQKLILFQNSSKRILKLMNLTHNLPKQKENLEIFLSKRKIYRKKKIRE